MTPTMPGPGVVIGTGADAGVDSTVPAPLTEFAVFTYDYGAGTVSPLLACQTSIDPAHGTAVAVGADELLWVAFQSGEIVGYELALFGEGEEVVSYDLGALGIVTPGTLVAMRVYRPLGETHPWMLIATGSGVVRLEVPDTGPVVRGSHVSGNFANDVRLNALDDSVARGTVAYVNPIPGVIWYIPEIAPPCIGLSVVDCTGDPRCTWTGTACAPLSPTGPGPSVVPEASGPLVLTLEAADPGFLWTGGQFGATVTERLATPTASGLPPPRVTRPESLGIGDEIIGIGGPDEIRPVTAPLVIASQAPSLSLGTPAPPGQIALLDIDLRPLGGSAVLAGPVADMQTRAVGSEVFAFAVTSNPPRLQVFNITATTTSELAGANLFTEYVPLRVTAGLEPNSSGPPPAPSEEFETSDLAVHVLMQHL